LSLKKRDFSKAATSKGYIEVRAGNHVFYRFKDSEGKICDQVHTKMSHSSAKDISDDLLAKMYKQMKFDKKTDLEEYIRCTFTEEKYRNHLRNRGYEV
jgi:predicted RNA binding protein YcfA (HicA-like mRNA interferase family)